jgi:ACS family hexuronate transporter-like MFS transporter
MRLPATPLHPAPPGLTTAHGHCRWVVCGLVFLATTINYVDRQVIGILKPELTRTLGWNEIDYSNIVFAFQVAYAGGYLLGGRLIDALGVRFGYALAVTLWSLAAMGHAWARSVAGFCAARIGLGFAEGANFPAAVKTTTTWFPRRERALATGIFNSGTNVGALVTPLLVPWLTYRFGWPSAFIVTGALGFLWLGAWLFLYHSPERHPTVQADELAYIQSDPPDPIATVSWLALLRYRQTWAFVAGMFLAGPIWWFYLYWIPDFLHKQHGLNLLQLGPPLVVIYLMTDVGSIGGGWLSSTLLNRGWSLNAARKTAMLVCALCVVPVFAAAQASGLWTATLLIGLAASAHQGFAANLYTMVSDTAPKQVVSSIVGIGGMIGAIGGMLIAKLTGYVLEWTGHYLPLFIIASCAYLVALAAIHLLNPRWTPMPLPAATPGTRSP